MKKRQRGILVLFCLSLVLPKGRAKKKDKSDVPSGKKRVHKIEAFNDIKRDQKAHECQERAKGFTWGVNSEFLSALCRWDFLFLFGNFLFDTHLLFPSQSFFFFSSLLLPSLRSFFYFFPNAGGQIEQKTNKYFHKITRRITSARVIYYLPLSLNRSGRKFKLSEFLLQRDCVARRR